MPITSSGLSLKLPFRFSGKTFRAGLGIGVLLYLCGAGFLWLEAPETLLKRGERLAAQTIAIDYAPMPETTPEQQGLKEGLPEDSIADADLDAGPDTDGDIEEAGDTTEIEDAAVIADPAAVIEDHNAPLNAPLAPAPFTGLYEEAAGRTLPVIRIADNVTPFHAYRRPFTRLEGENIISIVIMDIGLSDTASTSVMTEISPVVSVAISPYAPEAGYWMDQSRIHGHETWLQLPVEPNYYPMDDSGPKTLLINDGEGRNLDKLQWAMAQGNGYAGIVTGDQGSFMRSVNDARPVIQEIYKRGLGFVDGDTAPIMAAESIAVSTNGAYAHNNVWIDIPATPEHIAASLRRLEMLAGENGEAIGFIHATPLALTLLQDWIDGLERKGLTIAPLSALADPGSISR